MHEYWAPASPRGEIMTPDEIAGPTSFLLSPDAVGVNGHVLAVDDGMAARVMATDIDPGLLRARSARGETLRTD